MSAVKQYKTWYYRLRLKCCLSRLTIADSHPATGPETTFGTCLPSHVGANLQTKLIENALWHTNTSEAYSDMDEQTLSSGLMTLVPNYYGDLKLLKMSHLISIYYRQTIQQIHIDHWYRNRIILKLIMDTTTSLLDLECLIRRRIPQQDYKCILGSHLLLMIVMTLFCTSEPTPIQVMVCLMMESASTFLKIV